MASTPAEIQLDEQLNQLEREITALQRDYDQYFLGILQAAPTARRSRVRQNLVRLTNQEIRKTSLRFRAQELSARFVTLQTLWDRTLSEIEAGRYSRDKFRHKLKYGAPAPKEVEAPPPPPRHPLQPLFDEFVATRQRLGERTDTVSLDKLVDFVEKQKHAIVARYGDRPIEFKVVEEEGKTKLKAVLKKV